MAKHKSEPNEYIGQFDDGTYQTGTIRPPKRSSGLVALLLVAVIFLGGICSALGIVNVHLLQRLAQMDRETTPLSMNSMPIDLSQNTYLDEIDLPEPQLPTDRQLQLQIVSSPYYSAQESTQNVLSAQQIYHRNRNSLVTVQCLTHFGAVSNGIGVVLSCDGFLLVNHHVVDSATRIFVTLSDGRLLRACLVGSDSFSDLAVLYVPAEDLTPAVFSSNAALQVSDPSFFFSGLDNMQKTSIFSVGRIFATNSNSLTLIQTCQGGSIGPVFDSFGNIIGFQAGSISQYFLSADTKGTGLVIPTNTVRQIVADLLRQGRVEGRPHLGIEVEAISKVYQQYWQLPTGLLLTGVTSQSNAALCGLQEGDILMALDGKPITSRSDLYATLHNHSIGDTVTAVIYRDNQKFTVKLTIEDNKKQ